MKGGLVITIVLIFLLSGCIDDFFGEDDSKNRNPDSKPLPESEISMCIEKGQGKDVCLRDLAIEKNDPRVCLRIGDFDFSLITKSDNPSMIFFFEGLKESCLTQIAVNSQDQKICSYISTNQVFKGNEIIRKAFYKDDCYVRISGIKKDPEICDNILHSEFKAKCFTVQTILNDDMKYCDKISLETADDTSDVKVTCKIAYGLLNKNPGICEDFEDDYDKLLCKRMFNTKSVDKKTVIAELNEKLRLADFRKDRGFFRFRL